MNKKKLLLSILVATISAGFLYLYVWEKPRLETMVKRWVESQIRKNTDAVKVDIDRINFSFIPLQLEAYQVQVAPQKKLAQTFDKFTIGKIAARPSLLDILVGKAWLSLASIEDADLHLRIKQKMNETGAPERKLNIKVDDYLKWIPVSQINIQNIRLKVNVNDQYFVTTSHLYVKAYNEKSSLIMTVKDPDIGIKTQKNGQYLHFLADLQVMVTKNTISLSKIKIVKDSSFFLSSGNIIYRDDPRNISDMNLKTRASANFADLKIWSNTVYKNSFFDNLQGAFKADIDFEKQAKSKNIETTIDAELNNLQVGKVKLGQIKAKANLPNFKQVNIDSILATLPGDNKIKLTSGKIQLGENIDINADVEILNAQLHSFLKQSTIADIPVWLRLSGNIKCQGAYRDTLLVICPGAATINDLSIKNKSRSKVIVATQKVDVAGSFTITETNISYKAKAKLKNSTGESVGTIDFDKGFNIDYKSDQLDFSEVGPIGELKFLGMGTAEGSTSGDSRAAVFAMAISAKNFEFEDYFFGDLETQLNYKSGSLYFKDLSGSIESTRFKGDLEVNLLTENILADIQLPFFRMADVQQSILKKVDLKKRFLGSGSGRLQIDTPFQISQLNFNLDARLFKGVVFGEEYNEAKIKAQAVDGIIIIQEGQLQKEKTQFLIKGTIDTDLQSQLSFLVNDGYLQLSSQLKTYNIPMSGEFTAQGTISGPLANPAIKTAAKVENLIFNKKKYGSAIFSYDSSDKQTNLQFNLPEKLEMLLLFPESNFSSVFVNVNAESFDIAPLVSYMVSEDATRSYEIETSGELSGTFIASDFWASEFSSTIKKVSLDYKANKIETTIPTNIELKNGKLFLNEISFVGKKQHIKVTQPFTEKYRTKFVINSRMNIAFFKLFAPFIEKIDGYSTLRLELSIDNRDLKLIGSSYITDSFLKFPGFPHAFENISADVLFNQKKVLINSITGELAGGKVLGNGEVQLQEDNSFDLLINTNMENVNIDFPKGFRTKGNGTISLSGSKAPFLLSGNYDVYEGLIDSNFSSGGGGESTDLLQELLKKEVSSPLTINLDIDTKNAVEVRNTLVEGYILGKIKVFDKINAPRIRGEAHFSENAVIRFRDQEFDVTSSSFVFEGESPINPKLSLRSQTRMNGYDINLFLQGRATKPVLTWSSQPPLPETQIVSMLALGTLPDQFNQDNSSALNAANNPNGTNGANNGNGQGFEVGTAMLSNNPLGKELKERYDVDVQFSSSFDDQNNSAAPKVTVRKKVSKKLQISVSATTGSTNQQEGRATYELNNDLSAIFRITNQPDDLSNLNGNNRSRQNNIFGLDLEYRVEYD